MLISEIECSIVWIGLLHPLDEAQNSVQLMRNTIVRAKFGQVNREP
jgi:hypothetical protein